MKNFVSILSLFAFSASAFAVSSQDIASYKSGDSLAWYHELIREAYGTKLAPSTNKRLQDCMSADLSQSDKKLSAATEKVLLDAMKDSKISDEAFRLSAKILKLVVTEKSLPDLPKLVTNDNRAAPIFNVLITADFPSTDKVLIDAMLAGKKRIYCKLRSLCLGYERV